jgi:ATP-dependent Clp protease adapter protein ClpS
MKLSTDDIKSLKEILEVCSVAGIDSIIIDDGKVRGANESKTCAIISSVDVPRLSQKMGINGCSTLRTRLELFTSKDVTMQVVETERGEISNIDISSARTKVKHRCTSTALIKAPAGINDEEFCKVFITKDEVQTVLSAARVMSAKKICLTIVGSAATISMTDESSNSFKIELETPISVTEKSDDDMNVSYSTSTFTSVFKAASSAADTLAIKIGQRGTCTLPVIRREVVLLPQINEEDD